MAGFCVVGVPIVPPPGPPPPPPPEPTASVQVLGGYGIGSSFGGPPGNISVVWGPPINIGPLQAGDVLVAGIVVYHDSNGVDIKDFTGGLPSGWTMVSNNPNPGNPSNHGAMYVGLATHVVTSAELTSGQPTYLFSLSGAGATHNGGSVIMAAARNTGGIEAFTTAQISSDTNGKITAPSVATINSIELVFLLGFGVGFGGNTLTADNGQAIATNSSGYPPNPEGLNMFYYFSTSTTAPAQGITESRTSDDDAMSCYQVSMLPGAA